MPLRRPQTDYQTSSWPVQRVTQGKCIKATTVTHREYAPSSTINKFVINYTVCGERGKFNINSLDGLASFNDIMSESSTYYNAIANSTNPGSGARRLVDTIPNILN